MYLHAGLLFYDLALLLSGYYFQDIYCYDICFRLCYLYLLGVTVLTSLIYYILITKDFAFVILSFRSWFAIDRRTHLSYGFRPLGSFQACNQLHTTIYLGKQHHMQHLCHPMRATILSMPPHSLLMCHSPVCIILLSPLQSQTLTTWFISSCQAWVEMWGLALLPLDLKLERINNLNWATLIGPQISELLLSLDVFTGMEVV